MAWDLEFAPAADKQFARIDRTWQRRILDYLEDDVAIAEELNGFVAYVSAFCVVAVIQ